VKRGLNRGTHPGEGSVLPQLGKSQDEHVCGWCGGIESIDPSALDIYSELIVVEPTEVCIRFVFLNPSVCLFVVL
jgi:hypothetical protein